MRAVSMLGSSLGWAGRALGRAAGVGRDRTAAAAPVEPILFEWLTLGGLLVFATWLLGVRGVWKLLFTSDPTGLTIVIVVIFAVATLWAGGRSRQLQQQRQRLLHDHAALQRAGLAGWLRTRPAMDVTQPEAQRGWAAEYWQALAGAPRDADAPLDLLTEMTHGPHHTAWWVNGIQLKLGLLGKVIGFSILAIQIGQMQSFDAAQSQDLLRSLTSGLGVALLTTMVGLVGNILLGLQLTRLDRFADLLVADAQRIGLTIGAGAVSAASKGA
jgi:hypothetical protein